MIPIPNCVCCHASFTAGTSPHGAGSSNAAPRYAPSTTCTRGLCAHRTRTRWGMVAPPSSIRPTAAVEAGPLLVGANSVSPARTSMLVRAPGASSSVAAFYRGGGRSVGGGCGELEDKPQLAPYPCAPSLSLGARTGDGGACPHLSQHTRHHGKGVACVKARASCRPQGPKAAEGRGGSEDVGARECGTVAPLGGGSAPLLVPGSPERGARWVKTPRHASPHQ